MQHAHKIVIGTLVG